MTPSEDDEDPKHQRSSRGPGVEPPTLARGPAPAAIALQMEDLTLWVLERVAKFPRAHEFTVATACPSPVASAVATCEAGS